MTTTLTEVPDYYSGHYSFQRYPAKVNGRPGHFAVWSRDVERPNPNHVTWSPELVAILAEEYHTEQWKAEQAEKASRPELAVGDHVRLGDLVVEVPRRAGEYVDSVPCPVVEEQDHDPYVDQDGGPDEELRRAADVDQLGTQAYVAAVQVVNDPQITTEEAVRALELAVTRIQALIDHAKA